MTVFIHTKTNQNYIIDDVESFDIYCKAIEGQQIPEDEDTQGFRFKEVEE